MAEKTINIGGRLHSTATGNVVAAANEVFDYTKNKTQEEINADTYSKEETYNKNELNNLITTPDVQHITVPTFGSLPASGSADTIYRVSNWDGGATPPAVDASKYSEYGWDGSRYVLLSVKNAVDEVFDVSVFNAESGVAKAYETLTAALGGVPANRKKGGMSIKFIQTTPATYNVVKTDGVTELPTGTLLDSASSIASGTYTASQLTDFATLPTESAVTYYVAVTEDETTTYTTWVITLASAESKEYVQYRLMSTDWSNVVGDWQGVDSEPTAGSRNLVESGGVYIPIRIGNDYRGFSEKRLDSLKKDYLYSLDWEVGGINASTGEYTTGSDAYLQRIATPDIVELQSAIVIVPEDGYAVLAYLFNSDGTYSTYKTIVNSSSVSIKTVVPGKIKLSVYKGSKPERQYSKYKLLSHIHSDVDTGDISILRNDLSGTNTTAVASRDKGNNTRYILDSLHKDALYDWYWEIGSLDSSTGEYNPNTKTMICTPSIVQFAEATTIVVNSGFILYSYLYENGAFVRRHETSVSITCNAGTTYKFMIVKQGSTDNLQTVFPLLEGIKTNKSTGIVDELENIVNTIAAEINGLYIEENAVWD